MSNNSLDKVVSVSNLVRLIRRMEEYENWKRSVLLRDRFTCQHCGARNGRKRVIEADHIVSITLLVKENNVMSVESARNCRTLWDLSNGRTLCHACHQKTESYPVRFVADKTS